ncbi:hypothetical protein SAMN04488508_105322 [Aquimarina spongiae]|uniref:Uncharacterized protein n=1 Tax=Aquimarina spongiae TaxID=570521 RepID=A0A1M6GK93_9FLAO|nr:hypothetical protein SAMN04488508_105322 [Aquimarina spongiae]
MISSIALGSYETHVNYFIITFSCIHGLGDVAQRSRNIAVVISIKLK